jgi:Fe-S cluster assembly ATP-binding protein
MGPNGSGKSTVSKFYGHPAQCPRGEINFTQKDLLDMSPEVRSHEGLFLAFQYPIEISGVTIMIFTHL